MIKKIIKKFILKSKNIIFHDEIELLHSINQNCIIDLELLRSIEKNKIYDGMILNSIEQKYIYEIANKSTYEKIDKYENQKIQFLLFNYFLHIPMFSGKINIGDYVQTIAVKKILDTLYHAKYIWFDRDSISFFKQSALNTDSLVCCIMQGWFSHTYNFLPSIDIIPIWIGTHFTSHIQKLLRKVLVVNPNYFLSPV